jgi:uncharacterized protein YukJ
MNKIKKEDFDIPTPDFEQIEKTIKEVKEKHDIRLSSKDAIEYFKLFNELGEWFLMEENIDSPDSITDEVGEEMKNVLRRRRGHELDIYDAQDLARSSLNKIIPQEKERIKNEINALIEKYKSK